MTDAPTRPEPDPLVSDRRPSLERRHTARRRREDRWRSAWRSALPVIIGIVAAYFASQALTKSSETAAFAHRLAQITARQAMLAQTAARLAASQQTLTAKLVQDEYGSCVLQARGLPAGHQQVAIYRDLHALLTIRTPAARAAARHETRRERRLLADLDRHLGRYDRLERNLPATRVCTP